ncbi:MAG: ParA family protein [Proteobacteria bacterium]|nr:ParA family protein [Pseudomonadota bacterium]
MNSRIVSIISGKGGAGKTVLGLSIARVLAEAELRCLFVDCDIATHGATYFFETELGESNFTSLANLAKLGSEQPNPLETVSGFSFLPSTLSPENDDFRDQERLTETFDKLKELAHEYDVCVLDCQAGFSDVVLEAVRCSDRILIVLEPDAVSASALRVLYLQLGRTINASNTWQIFNKLTEEERSVYTKVFGGTLFPNLPPIPFDWQVRAAFSTREIPGVTSESSAFGLGVLRIMKTLFPQSKTQLEDLESRTVGEWFDKISSNLENLEAQKEEVALEESMLRKEHVRKQTALGTLGIAALSILAGSAGVIELIGLSRPSNLFGAAPILIAFSGIMAVVAGFYYSTRINEVKRAELTEKRRESLTSIDNEIDRYRTLILTDPRLRERARRQEDEPSAKADSEAAARKARTGRIGDLYAEAVEFRNHCATLRVLDVASEAKMDDLQAQLKKEIRIFAPERAINLDTLNMYNPQIHPKMVLEDPERTLQFSEFLRRVSLILDDVR